LAVAHELTRFSAAKSLGRLWERRSVLPSMAMISPGISVRIGNRLAPPEGVVSMA
jgi:hypothetical protein